MEKNKVRIKKYRDGTVRTFLYDEEITNVGSYELVEKRDAKSGISSIKIELIDLKEVIIEEE